MTSTASSWSNAPADILWKIIQQLPIVDYIRFGGVCDSWRKALALKRCPPALQVPWLMLLNTLSADTLNFISMFDNKAYRLQLPPLLRGLSCTGTSAGWMVLSSKSDLSLYNPISQKHVRLPPLSTFRVLTESQILNNSLMFKIPKDYLTATAHYHIKVVVSQHGSSGPITVAAVCEISCRVAFARHGDAKWTILERSGIDNFYDIAFCKDRLLVLSDHGMVVSYDVFRGTRVSFVIPPPDFDSRANHITKFLVVDSSGDLLQVWRQVEKRVVTVEVRVFKLIRVDDDDDDDEYEWDEIKELGDSTLFLSHESMSVSAKDVKELKGNDIYFVDRHAQLQLRVFDMGDRSLKLFKQLKEESNGFPVFWLTPTLH